MNDMNDIAKMTGRMELMIWGADGKLKTLINKDNLIVTIGKSFLAAWLAATSQSNSFMPYTAVGTGTSSPALGNTALQTELARLANTPGSTANVLTLGATYGPGVATGAITEAGLFSAASVGTMFSRVTFSVQNVAPGDTLIVNWSITFS